MPAVLRLFRPLVLLLLGACAAVALRAADAKFSATLTAGQRERAGLAQLSGDNLAVIDGLVRMDTAASKFKDNDVDHTRFTARHTPHERELAGLDRLTADQRANLDEYVYERISGNLPSLGAPLPPAVTAGGLTAGVKPHLSTDKLDIHGEISFTYGWGKGGSGYGTDVVLTYQDPAGRYGVAVGYSDFHGKGFVPSCLPGYGPYRAYPGMAPFGP
jgi:hypothetical protein